MTVAELIALLQLQDQNREVHMEMPSHDYWHTRLAPKVTEVDVLRVRYSEYHNESAIEELEVEDYTKAVLVIRSAI
jgi:hypothetical protein